MNCKSGELAMVLRGKHAGILHIIGSIVQIGRPCAEIYGYWHTTPPTISNADGTEVVWLDGDLKPLRPKGSDNELMRGEPRKVAA